MTLSGLQLLLLVCSTAQAGDYAARYSAQLEKLDRTGPESVCEARKLLRDWLPKAGVTDRAAMFRGFRKLYLDVIGMSTRRFDEAAGPVLVQLETLLMKSDQNQAQKAAFFSADPAIRGAIGPWLGCGISAGSGEGMWYPAVDPTAMLEFMPQLPAALRDYVRFRAREDTDLVAGDASLGLTWPQLGDRLKRWEDFARSHPRLQETDSEVKHEVLTLAWMFLFGLDNTPTYDKEGRIEPGLAAAWRGFVKSNASSRFTPLLREILARLERNGRRLTAEDTPLFDRYELGSEFAGWLRIVQLQNGQ